MFGIDQEFAAWSRVDFSRFAWLPRLAVIDDSLTRRSFLVDWLKERGFTVEAFEDGAIALKHLFSLPPADRPEIVLSDMNMPHVGGMELAGVFRSDPRLARTRLVLYSAAVTKVVETVPRPASTGSELVVSVERLPFELKALVERLAAARGASTPPGR